ncbi:MAG: hypothetical protein P1U29_03870 [Candidatus Pelagibacter bacterium]|jgi:hypothetical protein|nr:hypothetical protein [Candidatus Pelagibacter bacterium]
MKTSKFLTYGALGGVALYLLLRLKKNSKPSKTFKPTSPQMPTATTGGIKPLKPFPTKAVLIKEEKPDPKSPQVEPLDCKGKMAKWVQIERTSRFSSPEALQIQKRKFLGDCYIEPRRVGGGNGVTNGANLGNGGTNGANLGNGNPKIIIGIDTNKGNPRYNPRGGSNSGNPRNTGGNRGTPIDDSISDGRYRPNRESKGNRLFL